MNGMKPLLLDSPSEEWKMDGVPAYRVEQVRNWIFEKGVLNWDEMTNLPASLRADMNNQWATSPMEKVRAQGSKDTTQKFLS